MDEDRPKYMCLTILQDVSFKHNTTINTSTTMSPYQIMHGEAPGHLSVKTSPMVTVEGCIDPDDVTD